MSAILSVLGQKARPVACVASYGSNWHRFPPLIRQETGRLFPALRPVRRSSFRWNMIENTALTTTLGSQEGCIILSYDGANTFNSIYRPKFLPALAEIVPSVVSCAANLYPREPPNLMFALDERDLEVVESARGGEQGCILFIVATV